MKYNKKLILSVFLIMVISVSMVFALNLGRFSSATKIVYGEQSGSTDFDGAKDINEALATEISTTLGNESYLIKSHGNDLNFGESLNSVISNKLTYKDLPKILERGKVEYDDGSTEDYTQIITFGPNKISFKSLDDEDYQNSSDRSKQIPIPYLDLSGSLWDLIVEFDNPLDATDLDDDAVITIAGKEYHFAPDIEKGDNELVFYASNTQINLVFNEKKTIEIGGEQVTIEVIGVDTEGEVDGVFLKFNEKLKKIKENKAITINGEKVYANQILASTFLDYKISVELFIGADELVIDANNGFNNVEVNGKILEGIEAKVTGGVNATEKIEFRFIPTEMDDEDGIQFLEVGESVTDPLFGTFSMFFDSIESGLESGTRDLMEISVSGDELDVKFTNVDDNEIEFIPYYINSSDNINSNLVQGTIGYEDEIFIVQVAGDITEVFEIENIRSNNVRIYSYTERKSKDYEDGDELDGDTGVIITLGTDSITFSQPTSNILYTKNKMEVTLNNANIAFDEMNIDKDETLTNPTVITIPINSDNGDIEIGSLIGGGITQDSDKDGEYEYTITNGYGTYFVREAEDGRNLRVYIPKEETDFNVYISDIITTTATGIDLTVVKDIEGMGTGDVIVVGGSCINKVAAQLLGSSTPVCAEEFTILTSVSTGRYLYQVFDNGDGIAVLIAGYDATDTTRGVKEFLEGKFDLAVGTKLIK